MLSVQGVTFRYPGRAAPAVREVTASFAPGTVTAVVGPNGAGKSTLLRLLLGTITPTVGTVALDGVATASIPPAARAKRIAYLGQNADAAVDTTARNIVALGRLIVGRNDHAVERALAATNAADLGERPFHALSVGQRQRVMLARVLAQLDAGAGRPNPGDPGLGRPAPTTSRFILADEPAAAMDPAHSIATLATLRAFAAEKTHGVVVVLHDLTLARRFADAAVVLRDDGTPAAAGDASATLTPEVLQPVFGVRFQAVRVGEGVALVADR